ncbi:hypothetical protein [Mangrovicoccus sp. HB161399]|uniref:hypothetical protein n=1 Tax=Mangrovicoccus sp. HB161399 TaxID=2720392 RepID=UPI001553E0BE|nr:hypothetical protein [Mangrovicoccus sp. HB161399]
MVDEITLRLAYMSPEKLDALAEIIAANPMGPGRDRMPIPAAIVKIATRVEEPPEMASALLRGVLGSSVGARAIREGWAPELLNYLRERHSWVRSEDAYAIGKLMEIAEPNIRRKNKLDSLILNRCAISEADERFLEGRQMAMERCQQIADMARGHA